MRPLLLYTCRIRRNNILTINPLYHALICCFVKLVFCMRKSISSLGSFLLPAPPILTLNPPSLTKFYTVRRLISCDFQPCHSLKSSSNSELECRFSYGNQYQCGVERANLEKRVSITSSESSETDT